jgi:hypothetical protein
MFSFDIIKLTGVSKKMQNKSDVQQKSEVFYEKVQVFL